MGLFARIPNSVGEKTEKTVIAKGTRIVGRLELDALLLIDGVVEGELDSTSEVSIGTNGYFKGEMRARQVIVSGRTEGTVTCDKLEILNNGSVTGTAEVRELTIEPGGKFFGQSREAAVPLLESPQTIKSRRAEPELKPGQD